MLIEFAKRLKKERERLGLTQRELANAFGVNKGTVYSYERADRTPPGAHLTVMAELGADVLFIVTGSRTDESFTDAQLDKAYDVIAKLSRSVAWERLNEEERRDLFKHVIRTRPRKEDARDIA